MEKYYGALLILAGIVLNFFGNKFLTFVIHFVVAIAVIVIAGSLIFWAFTSSTPEWLKITAFVVVFLIANFVGFMVSRMRKLGVAIVAGAAGCALGSTICTAIQIKSEEPYYGIIIGTGVVFALVSCYIEVLIVIVATAFIGSFSMAYGVSKYAHHFPNFLTVETQVKDGHYHFSAWIYAYIVGILLFFIVGVHT